MGRTDLSLRHATTIDLDTCEEYVWWTILVPLYFVTYVAVEYLLSLGPNFKHAE